MVILEHFFVEIKRYAPPRSTRARIHLRLIRQWAASTRVCLCAWIEGAGAVLRGVGPAIDERRRRVREGRRRAVTPRGPRAHRKSSLGCDGAGGGGGG